MLVKVFVLVPMLEVPLEVPGATANRKVLVIFLGDLHVAIWTILPVWVLISLVPHLRWGQVVALLWGKGVWLLVEWVLIKGIFSVLSLAVTVNRMVLETKVRVIRIVLLTVASPWLVCATPACDDRAVVLLPLAVAGETHIITIANLCLLLLQIILRLGRVQVFASLGYGRNRW